jgi:hypothetical protein
MVKMIKFSELRTTLQTILKTLHARVFFQIAPDTAVMPYVVFDFPNSVDSGTLEIFVLDIDVWDDSQDTTALETLIDTIDDTIHKKSILINDKMCIVIYRENRLTLTDDDQRIRRRKYIYQAKTYQKYY